MTTYFISRHPGAREWAQQHGLHVDVQLRHLQPHIIKKDDTVFGTLPVNLAADLCARGARYFHLTMHLPVESRGKELTQKEMETFGASLIEYIITEPGKTNVYD